MGENYPPFAFYEKMGFLLITARTHFFMGADEQTDLIMVKIFNIAKSWYLVKISTFSLKNKSILL